MSNMAHNNWEADKMLDVYIYDYLCKRNLPISAKAFSAEAKVSPDPVAINAPGGFLFEWWSVFWDIFIARTNEKHSEVAASYIETQQLKAREQQQSQQINQQLSQLQSQQNPQNQLTSNQPNQPTNQLSVQPSQNQNPNQNQSPQNLPPVSLLQSQSPLPTTPTLQNQTPNQIQSQIQSQLQNQMQNQAQQQLQQLQQQQQQSQNHQAISSQNQQSPSISNQNQQQQNQQQSQQQQQQLNLQQLQLQLQQRSLQQRRDGAISIPNGSTNGLGSESLLRQSTANALATKYYEEKLKQANNQANIMRSDVSTAIDELTKRHLLSSNNAASLQQARNQLINSPSISQDGKGDVNSIINSQRNISSENSLFNITPNLQNKQLNFNTQGINPAQLQQLKNWQSLVGNEQVRPNSLTSSLNPKMFLNAQQLQQFQLLPLPQQQQILQQQAQLEQYNIQLRQRNQAQAQAQAQAQTQSQSQSQSQNQTQNQQLTQQLTQHLNQSLISSQNQSQSQGQSQSQSPNPQSLNASGILAELEANRIRQLISNSNLNNGKVGLGGGNILIKSESTLSDTPIAANSPLYQTSSPLSRNSTQDQEILAKLRQQQQSQLQSQLQSQIQSQGQNQSPMQISQQPSPMHQPSQSSQGPPLTPPSGSQGMLTQQTTPSISQGGMMANDNGMNMFRNDQAFGTNMAPSPSINSNADTTSGKPPVSKKRKQSASSGPANSSGANNPSSPPNSNPPTPSTNMAADNSSFLPTVSLPQNNNNNSNGNNSNNNNSNSNNITNKHSLFFPSEVASTLNPSANPLNDMDRFVEDGSLEDNVESFLSPDENDTRETLFGCNKRSPAGQQNDSKGFSFTEVGCLKASTDKVICCHFSSDGKLLASAGRDKKAILWNVDTFSLRSVLNEHSFLITDVRFSPNCSRLATSSFDKTVRVWDANNPYASLRTFHGHQTSVMSLDFHPTNEDLLCSCDGDNEIRYWSINQGECTNFFKGATTQIRFQPRTGSLLAAAAENVISIYDAETQSLLRSFKRHTKPVHSVCWDSTGDFVASVSEDSVRVWSLNQGSDGECVHELISSGNKFHSCVFHPKYSSLLVIGCYQSMELWNMIEGKSMTVQAHEGLIAALSQSSSTGLVASASHDKTVKLWS